MNGRGKEETEDSRHAEKGALDELLAKTLAVGPGSVLFLESDTLGNLESGEETKWRSTLTRVGSSEEGSGTNVAEVILDISVV